MDKTTPGHNKMSLYVNSYLTFSLLIAYQKNVSRAPHGAAFTLDAFFMLIKEGEGVPHFRLLPTIILSS